MSKCLPVEAVSKDPAGVLVYLIYVDEAGNTGTRLDDVQQPIHVVVGLPVPDSQWRGIEAAVSALVIDRIPEPDRPSFEFHAHELHSGKGYFRGWLPTIRQDIGMQLLAILSRFSLKLIWGACHKPTLANNYRYPMHPHDLAFLLVAERCERFLTGTGEGHLGMFIADRNAEVQGMIRTSLRQYRSEGIPLGLSRERLDHIIEDIHFQSSQASYFLQLADFCAYYIKRSLVSGNWDDPRAQSVSQLVYDGKMLP